MRNSDRTRLLPFAGAALVLLGIVMILLGWHGASETPLVFEQVPYLISGGQLGASLVTLGALLYFSYWLTIVARDQRETHRLLQALLDQRGSEPRIPLNGAGPHLVATSKGDMVHRPDCPVVRNREDVREVSESGGRKPCGICHPAVA